MPGFLCDKLMGEFMRAHGMTWIVAFTEEEVFNPDYGVRGIPHLAIVDAEGTVRYNGLHPSTTSLAEKSKKIDALLKPLGIATNPHHAAGQFAVSHGHTDRASDEANAVNGNGIPTRHGSRSFKQ